MQISQHYVGYPKKTLIVVTNNELAKLYRAQEREIEELEMLQVETAPPDHRSDGTPNAGPPDVDSIKKHGRSELYAQLSDRLLDLLKEGYEELILCAPEALKNELTDAMHTDVQKATTRLVTKNLASLPLDQIVRILQES